LANYASPLQQNIAAAYTRKDIDSFKKYSAEFIQLIDDMDTLLSTHPDFLLGKWIEDARSWGITPEEKNLYEFNARDLVTLWGDKNSELHEYSNRQWAGLLKDFYKPRWQQFFTYIEQCMAQRKTPDLVAFEEKLKDWEWHWVNSTTEKYSPAPKGNSIDVAKALYAKYHSKIIAMP